MTVIPENVREMQTTENKHEKYKYKKKIEAKLINYFYWLFQTYFIYFSSFLLDWIIEYKCLTNFNSIFLVFNVFA